MPTFQRPSGGKSSRVLQVGGPGLFALSSVFPLAASVLQVERLPPWVGVLDVVTALAVVALGMAIVSRARNDFTIPVAANAFRIYRRLANMLLILLVVFFVAGESIK